MSDSWINALNAYLYPVNLQLFKRKNEFPGFFERNIIGDRNSTIEFENYYRAMAPKNISPFWLGMPDSVYLRYEDLDFSR
jgi:hypothetical protein